MATSSNTLIATRSGEVLFIEKGSVLMNSQPMFITRHPRHRTGVHTCAVKTGSGTPGPPYHSHTRRAYSLLDQPPGRTLGRFKAPPGCLNSHRSLVTYKSKEDNSCALTLSGPDVTCTQMLCRHTSQLCRAVVFDGHPSPSARRLSA